MFRIVHNRLMIKGNGKDISDFLLSNLGYKNGYPNDRCFCFNAIVPWTRKYTLSKDWHIKYWGCDSDIHISEKCIRKYLLPSKDEYNLLLIKQIIFDTHKNPPLKWLEKVSKMFPNLEFELVCDPGWKGIFPIPRYYYYQCSKGELTFRKRDSLDFIRYSYFVMQK